MRKITFLLAAFVTLTLAACGSGSATTETTDSTAAPVDSSAVSQDSTAAQAPADTVVAK